MREILFRGQTRKFGEKVRPNGEKLPGNWVYGGTFPAKDGGCYSVIYSYDPVEKYSVWSNTVGQYTGQTDRNAIKIFEDDIAMYGDDMVVIEWDEEDAMFYTRSLDGTNWTTNFSQICGADLEVIGNIHDNPELLEGSVP